MRIRSLAYLAAACMACLASAMACCAATGEVLKQAEYNGTLGAQRIGLILNMQGEKVAPSRYYYLRHLTDIPLAGERNGSAFTLHEQGATMTLHFVGNGSEHGAPLDFNNSIGLEGEWNNGKTSLPVKLQGGGLSDASPPAHWYESITDQTDDVFEARAKGFCAAVAKGDSSAAAPFVHFPLRVNHGPGKHDMIGDAKQLAAQWHRLFTPAYVKRIADASPHSMPLVQGYAMLGDGLVFFSDKGVEVLNVR